MANAVEELRKRPLSLNLLKRMHDTLMNSVRGQGKSRGKFRTTQNWIGRPGSSQDDARYVPPDPIKLSNYLDNFEEYLHYQEDDVLVQAALIHGQFEILHPFLDGNGRIGRILIPLFLFTHQVLHQPMFYISAYLEKNRSEYYDRLKDISDNNHWEDWISFFLNAIITQADHNIDKAQQILDLYNDMKQRMVDYTRSQYAMQALDCLFTIPIFSSREFQNQTDIPKASASRIINSLKENDVIQTLEESRGRKPAIYHFSELTKIINR